MFINAQHILFLIERRICNLHQNALMDCIYDYLCDEADTTMYVTPIQNYHIYSHG